MRYVRRFWIIRTHPASAAVSVSRSARWTCFPLEENLSRYRDSYRFHRRDRRGLAGHGRTRFRCWPEEHGEVGGVMGRPMGVLSFFRKTVPTALILVWVSSAQIGRGAEQGTRGRSGGLVAGPEFVVVYWLCTVRSGIELAWISST